MYRVWMFTLVAAMIGCESPAPPPPVVETTIAVDAGSQPTLEEFKEAVAKYLQQARSFADKLEANPTAEEARVMGIGLSVPQPTAEQASSDDEVLHDKIITILTRVKVAPILIKEQRTRQQNGETIDQQDVTNQIDAIRRLCDDIETMLQPQATESAGNKE